MTGPKLPLDGRTIANLNEDQHPLLSASESDEDFINTPIEVTIQDKKPVVAGEEASWQIGLQVFFPYIVAGLGMVAAGMLLDNVQVGTYYYAVSSCCQYSWVGMCID